MLPFAAAYHARTLKLTSRFPASALLAAVTLAGVLALTQTDATVPGLREGFRNPPDDARIMMRWWWFGPAVAKPELEHELQVMKAAGIGGVEIQPVYPLELDDPQTNFHNQRYLSDEFLDDIRFTAQRAKELGLRVDITLGSGWPYGGPDTSITEAAGRLRCDRIPVGGDVQAIAVPALENGETLVAAFLARGDQITFRAEGLQRLTDFHTGRVSLPSGLDGPRVVLFFISSRTGQQVKRPSIGAEGFVLDHYQRAAIEHHLSAVGDRLLQAFGPNPPHAVFSDSLEVYGSDWTSDFLDQFQKRRGYDLTPHLPALVGDIGSETAAIRHDWGKTLTELTGERYLTPIREWAHRHRTLFRSQTYGEPPVILSSNALVDLPEGEMGPKWRTFSAARWASSANHLYSRNVTSSETWTWLHAPSFRATPLDMKAEADLHFIEGVNQLIGHGWPYSPPAAGEPGWRLYASAAFNSHNPWFQVMPEITRYLQRVSFLLRQGQPTNDVAIYLPTDDAWAQFKPGVVSVDVLMDKILGPSLIAGVLKAGYNFDFVDDAAIANRSLPYRVLILPGVERIPLATLRKLSEYVQKGGSVLATRRLPSLAPGFLEEKTDSSEVAALTSKVFSPIQGHARFLSDETALGQTLTDLVSPDFAVGSDAAPAIGFIHRKLPAADIYFVVNTSNQNVDTDASVRVANLMPEWWNPFTGAISVARTTRNGERTTIPLHLAPYESRAIVFSKDASAQAQTKFDSEPGPVIDLSTGWNVTFSGLNGTRHFDRLRSWTDDEQTRFYSGQAMYEKEIDVPDPFLGGSREVLLDCWTG